MRRLFDSSGFWIPALLALAAGLYWLRLAAPTDLEGYAQTRNIGYVLDVIHHDQWLTQHDLQGRILSKPPLHTWVLALSVKAFGLNRFALTFPSFVAVTALTMLVFAFGRNRFGVFAGGMAGVAVILSPLYSKQIGMVRSDAIFALAIAAGIWAAWRAWHEGKSWTLFWFVGALGTLTKGPLAVLLAGLGLIAWFWEKRSTTAAPRPPGSHRAGLLIYLSLCFAWVIPALLQDGRELVDMIFYGELLGQATGLNNDKIPFSNFPEPTLNLISRFAPFSFLAFYGLWRVFRRPAANPDERRFERFLTCAILGGLLVFSVAAHFRSDLILPLWAPCALLAGREASRLAERIGIVRFACGLAAATVALFAFAWWNYHVLVGPRAAVIRHSVDVQAAAEAFRATGIDPRRLHHINTPTTFQMYLGTGRKWTALADLPALIDSAPGALLIATGPAGLAGADIGSRTATEVFHWPTNTDIPRTTVRVFELSW